MLRRGLATYPLRMTVHNRNGLLIAAWLEGHPAVARVFYPGLASHPQHALAVRQMPGGFGGMMSFELRGGFQAALTVMKRIKVFICAVYVRTRDSFVPPTVVAWTSFCVLLC